MKNYKHHGYCDYCGHRFSTPYPNKKFCSNECRTAFKRILDRHKTVAMQAIRESVREIIRARNNDA